MLTAGLATALSLIAFVLHVAIWRIRRPRASAAALAAVFLGVLVAGLAALAFAAPSGLRPTRWSSYAELVLVYFGLMAAYINTYPAMEAESPSLLIMRSFAGAPDGLSIREIETLLGGDAVVTERIADLLGESYATRVDSRLVLTWKGRLLGSIFHAYRRLIGRGPGG